MTKLIDRVKDAAAKAAFHEAEAAKYNQVLEDLLNGKTATTLDPAVVGRLIAKAAPKRKRSRRDIATAKNNVFAFIKIAKRPMSISEIEDGVPHSFETVARCLKSLQLANSIETVSMVGSNGKPYRGYQIKKTEIKP